MVGISVHRFYKIDRIVRRILSFDFDEIYLCIPRTTRCGESFIGVSELEFPDNVKVIRGVDYGGITPIVYSSMIHLSDSEVYVINDTVDLIESPIERLSSEKSVKVGVTGLAGCSMGKFPFWYQIYSTNECLEQVDFLFIDSVIRLDPGIDTRSLTTYRPELIEFPDLRFALWCKSQEIELNSIGGVKRYVKSGSRRMISLKMIKRSFSCGFNHGKWSYFASSLGFLVCVCLLTILAMAFMFSLKTFLIGLVFLISVLKIWEWKYLF